MKGRTQVISLNSTVCRAYRQACCCSNKGVGTHSKDSTQRCQRGQATIIEIDCQRGQSLHFDSEQRGRSLQSNVALPPDRSRAPRHRKVPQHPRCSTTAPPADLRLHPPRTRLARFKEPRNVLPLLPRQPVSTAMGHHAKPVLLRDLAVAPVEPELVLLSLNDQHVSRAFETRPGLESPETYRAGSHEHDTLKRKGSGAHSCNPPTPPAPSAFRRSGLRRGAVGSRGPCQP